MIYEEFYKLNADPFMMSPDFRFSYEHESYLNARNHLEYALLRGEGLAIITGVPGTGKSTVIDDLLSNYGDDNLQVAQLVSSQFDILELLRMVAYTLGVNIKNNNNDKSSILIRIEDFLRAQFKNGKRVLLIVDEAQNLSKPGLEELRLLTNIRHSDQLNFQIFLLGQPSLGDLITGPDMEQFRQRLVASCHFDPLNLEQTQGMIEHRLAAAGSKGDPEITAAAFVEIQRLSGGIPRRINLICSRLLLHGAIDQIHKLDVRQVREVVSELPPEMVNPLPSQEKPKRKIKPDTRKRWYLSQKIPSKTSVDGSEPINVQPIQKTHPDNKNIPKDNSDQSKVGSELASDRPKRWYHAQPQRSTSASATNKADHRGDDDAEMLEKFLTEIRHYRESSNQPSVQEETAFTLPKEEQPDFTYQQENPQNNIPQQPQPTPTKGTHRPEPAFITGQEQSETTHVSEVEDSPTLFNNTAKDRHPESPFGKPMGRDDRWPDSEKHPDAINGFSQQSQPHSHETRDWETDEFEPPQRFPWLTASVLFFLVFGGTYLAVDWFQQNDESTASTSPSLPPGEALPQPLPENVEPSSPTAAPAVDGKPSGTLNEVPQSPALAESEPNESGISVSSGDVNNNSRPEPLPETSTDSRVFDESQPPRQAITESKQPLESTSLASSQEGSDQTEQTNSDVAQQNRDSVTMVSTELERALRLHLPDNVERLSEDSLQVTLHDEISFKTNSATLDSAAFQTLDELAFVLRNYDGFTTQVLAHTDTRGSENFNLQVSKQRASSIAEYLVKQGLANSHITAEGLGESKPLVMESGTPKDLKINRRIEFVIKPVS